MRGKAWGEGETALLKRLMKQACMHNLAAYEREFIAYGYFHRDMKQIAYKIDKIWDDEALLEQENIGREQI